MSLEENIWRVSQAVKTLEVKYVEFNGFYFK